MGEAGFCCDIKVMNKTERERYEYLRRKLESSIAETEELKDGYAFGWRSEAVSLVELAEWVDKERRCCAFFDFEIAVERDGGPVRLTLRGREGVKAFIRMEFGIR